MTYQLVIECLKIKNTKASLDHRLYTLFQNGRWFMRIQIGPCCLVQDKIFFWILSVRMRHQGLIWIKTKEYLNGVHFGIRCITVKFTRRDVKDNFYRARKQLKILTTEDLGYSEKNKIYLAESLTERNRMLFKGKEGYGVQVHMPVCKAWRVTRKFFLLTVHARIVTLHAYARWKFHFRYFKKTAVIYEANTFCTTK